MLKRAEQNNTSFAVVFIDLDGFKPINDALGHAAGDEVLKSVANRLKQCVRHNDVVARIGGDEFVLILSGIDSIALLSVARKIIDTIASTTYDCRRKTVISVLERGDRHLPRQRSHS